MSAAKEIVLITGSNTGLGYLVAEMLSKKACHIILTSRSLSKAQAAADKLSGSEATFDAFELDIASPDSIIAFAEKVKAKYDHIDIFVNNAAVSLDKDMPTDDDVSAEATKKRFQIGTETMAINVIGTDAVTYPLLPLLKASRSKSKRLIFVTSGLGSISENSDPEDPFYSRDQQLYRASKAGLNMLMVNWDKKLKDQGIAVYAICPGFNATEFGGFGAEAMAQYGAQDPKIGAKGILDVIEGRHGVGKEGRVLTIEDGTRGW